MSVQTLRNMASRAARFVMSEGFIHHPIRSVWRRLVWRIHWKLRPEQPFTIGYLNGLTLRLANSTASMGIYLNGGSSDPSVARVLQRYLRPNMVAFDVGAHIGEYTLLFASQVGAAGSVHSFEPDPYVLPFVRYNVEANRLKNVTVNELAVSDGDGTASFILETDPTSSHLTDFPAPIPTGGQFVRNDEVITVTIDAYVDRVGLSALDLIKVDVEGAEVASLRGAETTFRTLRPGLVFVECHSDELAQAAEAYLAGLGYIVDVDRGHMFPHLTARWTPERGSPGR
jgi:FkbM family methyltransferase